MTAAQPRGHVRARSTWRYPTTFGYGEMIVYYQDVGLDIVPWSPSDMGPYTTYSLQPIPLPQPPPKPPPVNLGPGSTKVDTSSIYSVARNMDFLIGQAQSALRNLMTLPALAPGGFTQAITLKTQVTGPANNPADLLDSYKGILTDISDGLTRLQAALKTIGGKYDQANNENSLSAAQLQQLLSGAESEFNMIVPGG